MGAATTDGDNSMPRLLPPITCVFAGMVATVLSSCARDCVAPEAVYAQGPPAGVDYGPGLAPQPYGQPPGSSPYQPPPGSPPPYGPPPGSYPYGPRPGSS